MSSHLWKIGRVSKIDFAVQMIDRINAYLQQDIGTRVVMEESIAQLAYLFTDQPAPHAPENPSTTVSQ